MTIYFARAGKDGLVKIGYSTQVRKRIRGIQGNCPNALNVIRTITAGRQTERWLHNYFRHLHKSGEWFEYSDEMLTITPPSELSPAPTKHQRWAEALQRRSGDNISKFCKEVGAAIGVHPNTVWSWHDGNSAPKYVPAICLFLHFGKAFEKEIRDGKCFEERVRKGISPSSDVRATAAEQTLEQVKEWHQGLGAIIDGKVVQMPREKVS